MKRKSFSVANITTGAKESYLIIYWVRSVLKEEGKIKRKTRTEASLVAPKTKIHAVSERLSRHKTTPLIISFYIK